MAFYVGAYLILQDVLEPKYDRCNWQLPDVTSISGHMGDTSNVEELYIRPENMTLVPTQIQYGYSTWTADEGFTPDHGAFREFYVRDEGFYVRNFQGTDYWTDSFYTPLPSWYVRSFTGTDYFVDSFYTPEPSWYVRSFTGVDFFTEFYVTGSFYVQNFTPTGSLWSWYPHETGYN